MTIVEALLVLLLFIVVIFLVYYYLRGSSGRVDITRPLESRIDEYLDRRFDRIVEEWALVDRRQAEKFREERSAVLARDEARMASLREFEEQFGENIADLEERLEALEKQFAGK